MQRAIFHHPLPNEEQTRTGPLGRDYHLQMQSLVLGTNITPPRTAFLQDYHLK
jgi:hypothetical protein